VTGSGCASPETVRAFKPRGPAGHHWYRLRRGIAGVERTIIVGYEEMTRMWESMPSHPASR
jgi:hypothetical protein